MNFSCLKTIVVDNESRKVLKKYSFAEDYQRLVRILSVEFNSYDYGYFNIDDFHEKFIPINNESDYQNALNNITGQGIFIIIKKKSIRSGPWKCFKCQQNNEEIVEICKTCKTPKRN